MNVRHISLIGGILAAVGSLMPWVTAKTVFGSIDKAGTEGDGIIALVLGVLLAIGSVERLKKPGRAWAVVIIGVLIIGLGIFEYGDIVSKSIDVNNEYGRINAGIGLWVTILGGFLGLAGFAKNTIVQSDVAVPPGAEPNESQKRCPQCAEIVGITARICRFCQYQFPPVVAT